MTKKQNTKFGTKEWADKTLNFCIGCEHNCLYCYAKNNAIRFNWIRSPEVWKEERVKPLSEVTNGIVKTKGIDYMIPSSHDLTPGTINRAIEVYDAVLAAHPDHRILIVSKPHFECIKLICDRYHGYKDRIMFRFTIKSLDNDVLSYWEPGAPPISERLSALEYAYRSGYETSISAEPMLDNRIYDLVKEVDPLISDTIWLGPGNLMKARVTVNTGRDPVAMAAVNNLLAKQTPKYLESLPEQLAPFIGKIRWKEGLHKILKDAGKI